MGEKCQQKAKEGRRFVPMKACRTNNTQKWGTANLAYSILLPPSLLPASWHLPLQASVLHAVSPWASNWGVLAPDCKGIIGSPPHALLLFPDVLLLKLPFWRTFLRPNQLHFMIPSFTTPFRPPYRQEAYLSPVLVICTKSLALDRTPGWQVLTVDSGLRK